MGRTDIGKEMEEWIARYKNAEAALRMALDQLEQEKRLNANSLEARISALETSIESLWNWINEEK